MTINIIGDCYVVGDIHGEASVLTDVLSSYDIKDCTLILLGDVGIWKYRDYKRYLVLDKYAAERNIIIYAFRGNHDNPIYFSLNDDSSVVLKRFWGKFTNFKPLPDFSILNINGNKGIVLGGGVSIDRVYRKSFHKNRFTKGKIYNNDDWWSDEMLPKINGIDKKIDFILTHTGPRPSLVAPLTASNCSFFKYDIELEDAIQEENKRLDEIHKAFQPKKWWFGHYHINDVFDYEQTRCYAVDILNISPVRF